MYRPLLERLCANGGSCSGKGAEDGPEYWMIERKTPKALDFILSPLKEQISSGGSSASMTTSKGPARVNWPEDPYKEIMRGKIHEEMLISC